MAVKSRKPSKQRKAQVKAPLHIRKKFLTASLSADLIAKYGVKRLTVRKGDTIKVLRGEWRGHEGKVVSVDYDKIALHIDGVTVKKADGTPVYYPVHPSNVTIINLDLGDKARRKIMERRSGKEVVIEEVEKEEIPEAEEKGVENVGSEEVNKEESKTDEVS